MAPSGVYYSYYILALAFRAVGVVHSEEDHGLPKKAKGNKTAYATSHGTYREMKHDEPA
jgi:hypothetical protein